jgi:hypothetical protein
VPEWTNGAVSKTVDVARRPWVRIPSLPHHLVAGGCRGWLDFPAEAWPSGRRHTPGKRVGGQLPRGFEPLSLRHDIGSPTCGFAQATVGWSVLGPSQPRHGNVADQLQAVPEGVHLGREQVPVGVKAGPAGGLRPPSGPAATRRSPGNRPHPTGAVVPLVQVRASPQRPSLVLTIKDCSIHLANRPNAASCSKASFSGSSSRSASWDRGFLIAR